MGEDVADEGFTSKKYVEGDGVFVIKGIRFDGENKEHINFAVRRTPESATEGLKEIAFAECGDDVEFLRASGTTIIKHNEVKAGEAWLPDNEMLLVTSRLVVMVQYFELDEEIEEDW